MLQGKRAACRSLSPWDTGQLVGQYLTAVQSQTSYADSTKVAHLKIRSLLGGEFCLLHLRVTALFLSDLLVSVKPDDTIEGDICLTETPTTQQP